MRTIVLGVVSSIGFSLSFWGLVSLARWFEERSRCRPSPATAPSGRAGLRAEWPAIVAAVTVVLIWPWLLELATVLAVWARWSYLETELAAVEAGIMLGCVVLLAELRARGPHGSLPSLWSATGEALLWLLLGFSTIAAMPILHDHRMSASARDWTFVMFAVASFFAISIAFVTGRLNASRAVTRPKRGKRPTRIRSSEVAVLIPAHNEQKTIARCLQALSRSIDMRNVFVGSDASSDQTVEIARRFGCNVDEIWPNRGKAGVLTYVLGKHRIYERYRAVLLLDADSELDPEYLKRALPLFDDPRVAAIAGHVVTHFKDRWPPAWPNLFVAYRWRLYRVLQSILRYGQTWGALNVAYIIPGFASMYRTSVLRKLEISAPGLVIEDFNMTFELHRKRLGRIAYSPLVRCVSQDPTSLRDYVKQVSRWNLGFWQTVRRNGVWIGAFWLSLGVFIVEVLVASVFFILLPIQLALHAVVGTPLVGFPPGELAFTEVNFAHLIVTLLFVDYAMTAVVAMIDRKPILLVYGLLFPLLRWLDAFLVLKALVAMWFVKSDGRWRSPARA